MYEQGETYRTLPGLTPGELTVLQLGHTVRQEQQERATDQGPTARRKYSKPAKSTSQAMREYAAKRN